MNNKYKWMSLGDDVPTKYIKRWVTQAEYATNCISHPLFTTLELCLDLTEPGRMEMMSQKGNSLWVTHCLGIWNMEVELLICFTSFVTFSSVTKLSKINGKKDNDFIQ